MIHSVTVTNYLGEELSINLRNPEETGLAITKIEGIGPGKADVNTTELATNDGSLFNSSRVTERNIVIDITLFPKDTIEESRHRTYKYFPLKQMLTLVIETDTRRCAIDGYVESNEPDIFSQQESLQISIICPNPFFRSVTASKVLFYGVDPLFKFPFSNESLTEKLIEFGHINHYTDRNIVYDGDSETGMTIKMHASGSVKNITIYKIQTRESMKIYTDKIETLTGAPLNQGDDLVITTVNKQQSIKLIRNGKEINVLNALDRKSTWLKLTKGENVFAYSAEEGLPNLEFYIEYNILYAGV